MGRGLEIMVGLGVLLSPIWLCILLVCLLENRHGKPRFIIWEGRVVRRRKLQKQYGLGRNA